MEKGKMLAFSGAILLAILAGACFVAFIPNWEPCDPILGGGLGRSCKEVLSPWKVDYLTQFRDLSYFSGETLDCSDGATTLFDLMQCIKDHIPTSDEFGDAWDDYPFFPPADGVSQGDFRNVVRAMLIAGPGVVPTLPYTLKPYYSLYIFTDQVIGETFLVLQETDLSLVYPDQVRMGWGTVIVNTSPKRNNLVIGSPHPLYDSTTWSEATNVFAATGSLALYVAGTHRLASELESRCQSTAEVGTPQRITDNAHNVILNIQAFTSAIINHFGANTDWNFIQFHGMGSDACDDVDIYITFGTEVKEVSAHPDSKAFKLKENFVQENGNAFDIYVFDEVFCSETGDSNVSGRLVNGVPPPIVCSIEPVLDNVIESFIHIEQIPSARDDQYWTEPVKLTWPETT